MNVASKIKLHGKVAGRIFTGAQWKLSGKKLEVVISHDDGTVVCQEEDGTEVTLHANDLVPGEFLGDGLAEYDQEPPEEEDIPY